MINITEIIERARYLEGGNGRKLRNCIARSRIVGDASVPRMREERQRQHSTCAPKDGAVALCYDGAGLMVHTAVCYGGCVMSTASRLCR